jgi:hypothetical protein
MLWSILDGFVSSYDHKSIPRINSFFFNHLISPQSRLTTFHLIYFKTEGETHARPQSLPKRIALQPLRPELPNEAILDPNPNQTKPLTPQEDAPISADPAIGSEGGGPLPGPFSEPRATASGFQLSLARPRETQPEKPASIVT